MSAVRVRPAGLADAAALIDFRLALWPDGSRAEHAAEVAAFLAGAGRQPLELLVAETADGELVGFAEVGLRSVAEDCRTSPVAFLEGWFVVPAARRRGVGRALVAGAEQWGRAQGCTEFASDTQIDNAVSAAAHHALGFEDAGAIRCFRKSLTPGLPPN